MKIIGLFALAMLLLPALHAEVALPEFSWDKYVGTSQWRVKVTEDDRLCGSGFLTKTVTISVIHNLTKAKVGNYGHGETVGIFYGNNLGMPQKDVSDGAGYSTLYSHDIVFSSDCSGFTSTYSWYYHDPNPQYDCTGTTKLEGTDLQSGCPALPNIPEIPNVTASMPNTDLSDAHKSLALALESRNAGKPGDSQEEAKVEALYQNILKSDPGNFWANWDMAELKKQQGNYEEFLFYFDKSASYKNIDPATSAKLKQHEANELGLTELPSPGTSVFISRMSGDLGNAKGQTVYGEKIPDGTAGSKSSMSTLIHRLFNPDSWNIFNELAYQ